MSNLSGIEAAAFWCKFAAKGSDINAVDFQGIIAKHCVGKEEAETTSGNYALCLAACKEYREKLDNAELEVKRLARIAGFNSPYHVNT